jgi:hypothetical protein
VIAVEASTRAQDVRPGDVQRAGGAGDRPAQVSGYAREAVVILLISHVDDFPRLVDTNLLG